MVCRLLLIFGFIYVRMWYLFLGTIGHVAHGKSTLVKAISGVQVIELAMFGMQFLGDRL